MENFGTNPGIFDAPAVFEADYQQQQQQRPPAAKMTSEAHVLTTPSKQIYAPIDPQQSGWLDTPANLPVANHFEPSNVRGSIDQDPGSLPSPAPVRNGNAHVDAVSHAAWPYGDEGTPLPTMVHQNTNEMIPSEPKTPSNTTSFGLEKSSAIDAIEAEQLTRAYAMLVFRDSHCYITTPNLVIVRDVNFLQDWQAQEKERKRRAKAHEALQQYALEPSQPSQPGDDDRHDPSSRSGDSLVGRPEHGLLSHYSEQGGPVAYALSDEEEEMRSTQRKRRLLRTLQNSSSANSIAPQNLQANEGSEFILTGQHFNSDGRPSDPLEWAQLPVHPPRPEDIKKISREHLIFSYNSDVERWELKVIGNRAFVNGTLYDKNDVVTLSHNDEIIIASLTMSFRLPENQKDAGSDAAGDEVMESVEAGSRGSLSPSRRYSYASEASDDGGNDVNGGEPRPSRITLKLSLKKNRGKDGAKVGGKGKGKGKGESTASVSPEATKKVPKVRKPSETAETVKKESSAASPPTLPLNLDPNSTLAGLAPDELPEKRKGPGRPPKNGLVSKRDEAIIRKKIKEREKKGLPIPEYRVLLEETRNENKQRDIANKAQARGEPVPDVPVPSTENARATETSQSASQPPSDSKVQGNDSPAVPERKPEPKPRKVARSPSPMRPESDFTEEEMKKPNMTYIYIIDEILQNVEGGRADLQTIYDKIHKRWPFFYYRTTSTGWQSSVRHNLLSSPRFHDAGKSGKGKLWAINYEHQLDKQKQKASPQPTRQAPHTLQNGQYVANGQAMPQQWYGQPPHNGPFGPPNPNGQIPPNAGLQSGSGTYYSPYAPSHPMPPGNHPSSAPGSSVPMQHARPPVNGPYQRNGSQTPQPPPHQPNVQQHPPLAPPQAKKEVPFQPVVDEIMNYRVEYLKQCKTDSAEYKHREEMFKKGTQYFSNLFHQQDNDEMDGEDLDREPFSRINEIFLKYRSIFTNKPPQNNGTSNASGSNGTPQAETDPSATSAAQQLIGGPQGNSQMSTSFVYTNMTGVIAPSAAPTAILPTVSPVPGPTISMATNANVGQAIMSLPVGVSHATPSTAPASAPTAEAMTPATSSENPSSTVPGHNVVTGAVHQNSPGIAGEEVRDTASSDQTGNMQASSKRAADGPVESADTKRLKTG